MKGIGFWSGNCGRFAGAKRGFLRVVAFCVCGIISLGLTGCTLIGGLIFSRVANEALELDTALNAMAEWHSMDISMYIEARYNYHMATAEARIAKQTDEDGTAMLIETSQNGGSLRGYYYLDGWFVKYDFIEDGLVANKMEEQVFVDEYWGDSDELVDIGDPVSVTVQSTSAREVYTLVYEDADLSYFADLTGLIFSSGDLVATIELDEGANISSIRYELEVEAYQAYEQKSNEYTIVVETIVNAFDETVSIAFPDDVHTAIAKKQSKFVLTLLAEPVGAELLFQNKTHLDYDEQAIISTLDFPGYTFLGWFEGEELFSKNLTEFFNMPAKNLTLTAKYQKSEI